LTQRGPRERRGDSKAKIGGNAKIRKSEVLTSITITEVEEGRNGGKLNKKKGRQKKGGKKQKTDELAKVTVRPGTLPIKTSQKHTFRKGMVLGMGKKKTARYKKGRGEVMDERVNKKIE